MRDEHLIYKDLPNGRIKIIPADGYRMVYKPSGQYMSEAITVAKYLKYFVSEVIEE